MSQYFNSGGRPLLLSFKNEYSTYLSSLYANIQANYTTKFSTLDSEIAAETDISLKLDK